MKNLTNVLKNMEKETIGVKNDVITFLLEDVENYSPQDKLKDLLSNCCESEQLNHLTYDWDTFEYSAIVLADELYELGLYKD